MVPTAHSNVPVKTEPSVTPKMALAFVHPDSTEPAVVKVWIYSLVLMFPSGELLELCANILVSIRLVSGWFLYSVPIWQIWYRLHEVV